MADAQKPLTPSAIKYLLTLLELCQKDAGARCMDIAEQLRVTKPSVHSMIENLCAAGLAEKKKYGTVFLTPEGRMQAERYAAYCSLLRGRMQQTLGLNEEDARSAACAVLAQLPDAGAAEPRLLKRRRQNGASHIRTGRRRGLRLHRRSQGRLPEADKKMTGAVRLHKKKSAVRRIFSTYLQFSQPVRRPQPCR